jgi:hypothetical protein
MTLPGFNAETSLHRTSIHYRSMGALVQADGVTFERTSITIHPFKACGPCYYGFNGCSRDCGFCVLFPYVHCYHWTEHCPCETEFGCPIGPCNRY